MKNKIQKYLLKYPQGLKASQLADLIGTDRRIINSYLYGSEGSKYFEVDSDYIWRIKQVVAKKAVPITPVTKEAANSNAVISSNPKVIKPVREYRYLPKRKDLLYRSVFWVYQNKTYYEEKRGGFLWSPKYAINGRRHPGYESMKEVRPGDIIIHGYKTNVVAISIAKSICVSFDRPSSSFSEWAKDGWKIECEYFEFPFELSTDSIGRKLYDLQPGNGPLIAPQTGKQQYLCNANKEMLDCILNAYVSTASRKSLVDMLLKFLELEKTIVLPPENNKKDQELFEDIRVKKIDKKNIEEGCKIAATILSTQKDTVLTIDTNKYPKQRHLIGMTIGEVFELEGVDLKYRIKRIWIEIEQ